MEKFTPMRKHLV